MGACLGKSTQSREDLDKQTQPQRQKKQLTKNQETEIQLIQVRDKIMGKENQLLKQIENQEQTIVQLVKEQKKDRAKFCMEKKKLYVKYLDNVQNKSKIFEKLILEVRNATIDKDCADVMKNANSFLKDVQQTMEMDLENAVEDLKMREQEQEKYDQLFQEYGVDKDQDGLEKEYEQLEAQMVGDQINLHQIHPVIDQKLIDQKKNNQQQQQQQQQPQKNKEVQHQVQQQQNKQASKAMEFDELLA